MRTHRLKLAPLTLAIAALSASGVAAAQSWLDDADYNPEGRFENALDDGTVADELDTLQNELDRLRRDPRVRSLAMNEVAEAQEFLDELDDERHVDEDDLDEAADRVEAVRLAALGEDADFDDADDARYAEFDDDDEDVDYDERATVVRDSDDSAHHDARLARDEATRARADAEAQREAALAAQLEAEHEKNRNARLRAELGSLQSRETERGLVVTLGDVLFESGKSELKPGAARTLDQLVKAMKTSPDARVVVEGHTDSVGKHDYNVKLSQRRAEAVRSYLVRRGVAANRIEAQGMGPDYPVATNNSATGRQQNRRVELIIQNEVSGRRVARDEQD